LSNPVDELWKTMKKAIIVGQRKILGQALAEDGYKVGFDARRPSLFLDLQHEIGNETLVKRVNVSTM
jgi:hypothetical protein